MKLAALVLAAGKASRFGGDKLSAPFRSQPLIAHAIRAARASGAQQTIVVCAPDLALGDADGIEVVQIESAALSASLKAGVMAAGNADGVLVFLGDMPLVPFGMADHLAAILGGNIAAVPSFEGRRGHPVLLSRRCFGAIMQLEGDCGAARLLNACSDIAILPCADEGVVLDVDTLEDLAFLEARMNDPPKARN